MLVRTIYSMYIVVWMIIKSYMLNKNIMLNIFGHKHKVTLYDSNGNVRYKFSFIDVVPDAGRNYTLFTEQYWDEDGDITSHKKSKFYK